MERMPLRVLEECGVLRPWEKARLNSHACPKAILIAYKRPAGCWNMLCLSLIIFIRNDSLSSQPDCAHERDFRAACRPASCSDLSVRVSMPPDARRSAFSEETGQRLPYVSHTLATVSRSKVKVRPSSPPPLCFCSLSLQVSDGRLEDIIG